MWLLHVYHLGGHTYAVCDIKWQIPNPAINPAAVQLLITALLIAGALERSTSKIKHRTVAFVVRQTYSMLYATGT